MNVARTAIGKVVRKDLGFVSRAVTKLQAISAEQRKKRAKTAQTMLTRMKNSPDQNIVFSDEKN